MLKSARTEIRNARAASRHSLVTLTFAFATGLLSSASIEGESCDAPLSSVIQATERLFGSRPSEGAGMVLVEYDPEDLHWARAEMTLIREACSRGSEVEAVWRLERVQRRMKLPENWQPVTIAQANTTARR